MSLESSPEPPRRSPKRTRSPSPDAALAYAYDDDDDEEDFNSDTEHPSAFRTPDQRSDDDAAARSSRRKRAKRKIERPRRLHYVPYMTLRAHKLPVAAVKFSPDGRWIASCSADSTIRIWDAHTGALSQTLEGHLAGISTIAWSPDSKFVASGSDDKIIRLWDITSGKSLPSPLIGHHNYVYSLAFSPKGNMLVSGSYDEAVFLWDVRTARLMRSLPAHSDPVSGVDFVRDGTLVASCSSDGLIRIWDTSTGQCLKTLVHEDNAPVTSVKFSPNGKFVLAGTLDSSLRLWDYVDGRCVKTYQGHKNETFSIHACFGSYGELTIPAPTEGRTGDREHHREHDPRWAFAACGSEDGKTFMWDVSSKEILQVLEGHQGAVLGVDVGLEDQSLVTCGVDKTIIIWKRQPLQLEASEAQNGSNVPTPSRPDMPSDEELMRDSDAG